MAGEVRFEPTEEDFVAVTRANYVASLRRARTWRRCGIFVIGAAILGATLGAVLDRSVVSAALMACGYVVLAVVLFPLVIALNLGLLPRRARRAFQQSRALHRPFNYRWSAEGIAHRSSESAGRRAWSDLHGWRETPAAFLFYINEGLFEFVLKRAMTDEQQADLRTTAEASGAPIH